MRTMTLVPRRRLPRPMWCRRPVVADGDHAGGVDFVVTDAVVRRDLVSAGKGFGPGVKRLDGGVSADGAKHSRGLAGLLHITQTRVSRIERGDIERASVDTLRRYAEGMAHGCNAIDDYAIDARRRVVPRGTTRFGKRSHVDKARSVWSRLTALCLA